MNVEKIGEPVRVLADCSGGSAEPVRFRWSNRTYRVEQINGRWIDRQAGQFNLHFSVQSGGQTYYLHFDTGEVQWWLDQTVVE